MKLTYLNIAENFVLLLFDLFDAVSQGSIYGLYDYMLN
jgi:hypothetical protein